jgi:hypothetical protein
VLGEDKGGADRAGRAPNKQGRAGPVSGGHQHVESATSYGPWTFKTIATLGWGMHCRHRNPTEQPGGGG